MPYKSRPTKEPSQTELAKIRRASCQVLGVNTLFRSEIAHSNRLGENLNADLRNWIDRCIVPILVKEYLSNMHDKKDLAAATESMSKFENIETSLGEVTS
jgi:hypothetical protein